MELSLALRLLFHDMGRLFTALAGISIAVLLMLVQLGFRNAIFDSGVQLIEAFDADVVIQSANKSMSLFQDPMPSERLYQARSVQGVSAAHPIWMSKVSWKNLESGKERPIRLLGFEPDAPPWLLPDAVGPAALALETPDTALIDRRARKEYGNLEPGPAQLGRRNVRVVGQFPLGSDFTVDGNVMVGVKTFVDVSRIPEERVEFILVKAAPGVSADALVEPLRAAMPRDVLILTKAQTRDRDTAYWSRTSPVGLVMGVGMVLGFLAGVGIVYQILFAQIADYMKEFATLRAIGWSGTSIVAIVLFQAILLAILGYLPSLGVGVWLYAFLERTSGLPLQLTLERAGLVLGLTSLMCLFAGLFAVRRLLDANPADLF